MNEKDEKIRELMKIINHFIDNETLSFTEAEALQIGTEATEAANASFQARLDELN